MVVVVFFFSRYGDGCGRVGATNHQREERRGKEGKKWVVGRGKTWIKKVHTYGICCKNMNKRIMKTKTRLVLLGDIVVMRGREGVVRNVDAKEWDVLDVGRWWWFLPMVGLSACPWSEARAARNRRRLRTGWVGCFSRQGTRDT